MKYYFVWIFCYFSICLYSDTELKMLFTEIQAHYEQTHDKYLQQIKIGIEREKQDFYNYLAAEEQPQKKMRYQKLCVEIEQAITEHSKRTTAKKVSVVNTLYQKAVAETKDKTLSIMEKRDKYIYYQYSLKEEIFYIYHKNREQVFSIYLDFLSYSMNERDFPKEKRKIEQMKYDFNLQQLFLRDQLQLKLAFSLERLGLDKVRQRKINTIFRPYSLFKAHLQMHVSHQCKQLLKEYLTTFHKSQREIIFTKKFEGRKRELEFWRDLAIKRAKEDVEIRQQLVAMQYKIIHLREREKDRGEETKKIQEVEERYWKELLIKIEKRVQARIKNDIADVLGFLKKEMKEQQFSAKRIEKQLKKEEEWFARVEWEK